jgi:hypothetical protein
VVWLAPRCLGAPVAAAGSDGDVVVSADRRGLLLASAFPRGDRGGVLPSFAAFLRAHVRPCFVALPEGDFVHLVVPESAAALAACVFAVEVQTLEPFGEACLPGPLLRPDVRVNVLFRRRVTLLGFEPGFGPRRPTVLGVLGSGRGRVPGFKFCVLGLQVEVLHQWVDSFAWWRASRGRWSRLVSFICVGGAHGRGVAGVLSLRDVRL